MAEILNEKEAAVALEKLVSEMKKLAPQADKAYSELQPRGASPVAGLIGDKVAEFTAKGIEKVVFTKRSLVFGFVEGIAAFKRARAEQKAKDALWDQTVRNVKAAEQK